MFLSLEGTLSKLSWDPNNSEDIIHTDCGFPNSDISQLLEYHDSNQKLNSAASSGTYQPPIPSIPQQMSYPETVSLSDKCIQPTWKGFIHTTNDGLIILEACLQGILSHIPRRPHERERHDVISSGNIIVYEENASGIRRWTDGITWSPSRIMGDFLVYRELMDGHQPGEKRRAARKRKRGSERPGSPQPGKNGTTEDDRPLIGSLSLESYSFKPDGLAKKTLSLEVRGIRHHLISYYRVEDVKHGRLRRPIEDDYLSRLDPRVELHDSLGLKWPVEDEDDEIKTLVSSHPQIQPSQHAQLVKSGIPVVVNVLQQVAVPFPGAFPRTLPLNSSPKSRQHASSLISPVFIGSTISDEVENINLLQHHHFSSISQNFQRRSSGSNTSKSYPGTQSSTSNYTKCPAKRTGSTKQRQDPHFAVPNGDTSSPQLQQQLIYFNLW